MTANTPSTATPPQGSTYPLGTDIEELTRLGLQHRLWSDAAHTLWRRAQIAPGKKVLDLGCGPGYAAVELAQLVTGGQLRGTGAGQVVAVDNSSIYIEYLQRQIVVRDLPQVQPILGDVRQIGETLREESGSFDTIWSRWLMCFLDDPQAVVEQAASLLRPGGGFAMQDYFNYRSMTAMPHRASLTRAVEVTQDVWRAHGGNADVMGDMPRYLEKAGFRIEHIEIHQRLAGRNDSMFQWPNTWWRIWGPKLVGFGALTQAQCDELIADLDEISRSDCDYLLTAPVTEIYAVKR